GSAARSCHLPDKFFQTRGRWLVRLKFRNRSPARVTNGRIERARLPIWQLALFVLLKQRSDPTHLSKATQRMAAVVLKDVSKTYPNVVQDLSDLDLRVADGELVVLLGPSGCGKTTTLRLIAGLEEPTAGAIAIDGQHVRGVPARERNVALVFQRSTLYPHVDV